MPHTPAQDEIGSLSDLWLLNLKKNQLRHLPHTIGLLKSLRWLDLSGNTLVELPLGKGRGTVAQ